jgi:hypothetical protein
LSTPAPAARSSFPSRRPKQAPKSYSQCHCCAWASRCVFLRARAPAKGSGLSLTCSSPVRSCHHSAERKRAEQLQPDPRNRSDRSDHAIKSLRMLCSGWLPVATLPTMAASMRCLAVLLLVSFLHTRDMLHNTARALTHRSLGRSPRARVYATPRRTRLLTARPCAGRRSRGFHGGQRLRCHLDHGERPGGDAQVLRRGHYKAGLCLQRAVSRPI